MIELPFLSARKFATVYSSRTKMSRRAAAPPGDHCRGVVGLPAVLWQRRNLLIAARLSGAAMLPRGRGAIQTIGGAD
jgi:hypothetical protein